MSRWSEAFDAIGARDTVDTVDSVQPPGTSDLHSVNSVNSVSAGNGAVEAADIRTEGERWIEAYRRDAVAWMLQAISEAAADGAEAEPDMPLWPDPGTPERERLDRRNAAVCAGLRVGFQRHHTPATVATNPKRQRPGS
jgi:hypothetical protein